MEVNKLEKTQLKLEYNEVNQGKEGLPVIIVAAGSSSRMGKNKQFLNISSIPLIARTLMAFENSEKIKNIILVVRNEDVFQMQNIAQRYMISKLSDIVCGGDNRQQSVLNGLSRIDSNEKKVLVHDGARPLVTKKVINNVVSCLQNEDCVVCGVKPKDTIKTIDIEGKVVNTPDRNKLFAVQTPQGVDIEKYKLAIKEAKDINNFTDDASIMENAGYSVLTVEGDYRNIKVTTAEDIIAAECFLKEMEECE